ncbi:MAG: hypothetical protein ACN6O6_20200 [Pseudomonas sp.]|uniref:hypothetical protein n=1 Tax=Pseudomonas sp. TaxID=306 RepID=UPI003D10DF12
MNATIPFCLNESNPMVNPRLRILLAEPEHDRQLSLEKAFNRLGYYRIAPVDSAGEVALLIEQVLIPFDLLVINADLIDGPAFNLEQLLSNYPRARYFLIYNSYSLGVIGLPSTVHAFAFFVSGIPDREQLQHVMTCIDPTPSTVQPVFQPAVRHA